MWNHFEDTTDVGPVKRAYKISNLGIKYIKDWCFKAKEDLKIVENIINQAEKIINTREKNKRTI